MSSLYKPKLSASVSAVQSIASLSLGSNSTLSTTLVNKYVFVLSSSSSNVLTLPAVGVDGSWVSLHNSSSSNAFQSQTASGVAANSVATGTTANWMAVSSAWVAM